MARGGERRPSPRTPPGGPGQFSRRTDGQQIATPGLSGSDLQYGDVQRLEAAQKTAPLPAGTPPPRVARRQAGSPVQAERRLPSHLTEMEPAQQEPTTTGLDMGPGAGSEVLDARAPSPDLREVELVRLWTWYQNKDAFDLLQKLREERAAQSATAGPGLQPPIGPPGPQPVIAETTSQEPPSG